jgi:hypothetical protein
MAAVSCPLFAISYHQKPSRIRIPLLGRGKSPPPRIVHDITGHNISELIEAVKGHVLTRNVLLPEMTDLVGHLVQTYILELVHGGREAVAVPIRFAKRGKDDLLAYERAAPVYLAVDQHEHQVQLVERRDLLGGTDDELLAIGAHKALIIDTPVLSFDSVVSEPKSARGTICDTRVNGFGMDDKDVRLICEITERRCAYDSVFDLVTPAHEDVLIASCGESITENDDVEIRTDDAIAVYRVILRPDAAIGGDLLGVVRLESH